MDEHTFDYVYDLINQVLAAQAVNKGWEWTTSQMRQAARAAAEVVAEGVDHPYEVKGDSHGS